MRGDVVWRRGVGGKSAPVNLHVAFLAVADVAADVDVEAGEVGRGVEEIDEILAAEDVGFGERFVGAEFTVGDGRNAGGFGLA